MAKWLMTVFILVIFAPAAIAGEDPGPEALGVYFDKFGDRNCKDDLEAGASFSVWFVYTNPSQSSILGFEAGYHTTAAFVQLGLFPPCDILTPVEPELDNLHLACPPFLVTTQATPLYRIDYLYLGFEAVDATFHLERARESTQPGNNPHIILTDGSYLEVQAGYPAYTTVFCGVPTEKIAWGSIKSLYR